MLDYRLAAALPFSDCKVNKKISIRSKNAQKKWYRVSKEIEFVESKGKCNISENIWKTQHKEKKNLIFHEVVYLIYIGFFW